MRELSLFTGAGGGVLGSKLLGWETIGYVEYENYCQKVIKQRIADGILDATPIFGDIRKFISEGYAKAYQGMVDVITAGFPCQPFSVAGKNLGEDDPRNMWPQTIEVIRLVRPRYALLENVAGLLAHEYIRRIFGDLVESGYDCRWRVLSAAEVGAPHKRDRLWILADSKRMRQLQPKGCEQDKRRRFSNGSQDVANTNGRKCKTWEQAREQENREKNKTGMDNRFIRSSDIRTPRWWSTEPNVGRVAHGVAYRVDRLKAIGNGQVSAVVATAWRLLNASTR